MVCNAFVVGDTRFSVLPGWSAVVAQLRMSLNYRMVSIDVSYRMQTWRLPRRPPSTS
jgi:hypothetical protein